MTATKEKKTTKFYGTGRRKRAVAKVWLSHGKGKVIVNGCKAEEYFFNRPIHMVALKRPFVATNTVGRFDVSVKLLGGGVTSQSDAVRMGISRALVVFNPDLKKSLRTAGLLTRDPREKERKKYGHKRARKSFQYTKR
jgi:small subunit ribosomal protein S9